MIDYSLLDDFMNKKTNNIKLISTSEVDTKNISKYISKFLKQKDVIVLNGELGSGKTLFTTRYSRIF